MISIIQLKHCDYHRSLGIVNDTGVKATDGMGLENRCLHGLGAGNGGVGMRDKQGFIPRVYKGIFAPFKGETSYAKPRHIQINLVLLIYSFKPV